MPREYLEPQLMKEMGWSYRELCECPNEIVNSIIRYMNTEAKFNKAEADKWHQR